MVSINGYSKCDHRPSTQITADGVPEEISSCGTAQQQQQHWRVNIVEM